MKRYNEHFVDLSAFSGTEGRRDSQSGWQSFVGSVFSGTTILDCGSGLGHSRPRLSVNENKVTLLEPAPEMPADIRGIIDDQPDNSYELVTSFDVIEHIPDDEKFLDNLLRVSTQGVFLTTPNYNVFGCKNKFHVREYKPEELADLCLERSDQVRYFVCNNTMGRGPSEVSEEQFRQTMAPALAVLIKKKETL